MSKATQDRWINARVEIRKNAKGGVAKYFIGKQGRVLFVEDGMLIIYFDSPVVIPELPEPVTTDLFQPKDVKRIDSK